MSIDLKKYQLQETPTVREPSSTSSAFDWLNRDIQLFGQQLSMKQKEAFYSELEVLLRAGLDLKTALELVEEGQVKKKEKKTFKDIGESIVSGAGLSQAMDQSGRFTTYEIQSIRIAEESGKLPPILAELGTYFAKNLQYRRLLISALSYPVLVITVALLVLLFLLNFLVPMFSDIYARVNQNLPPITVAVVNLSEWVKAYYKPTILAVFLLGVFLFWQRKQTWLRRIGSRLLLVSPIFGPLFHQLYLARFCQAMAFLLESRIPVLNALELTRRMVGFYPIEHSLDLVGKTILKGQSLHESMRAFPIYPTRMLSLLKVGEEANQLQNMFAKLAAQYNDAVEQRTKMLGSLIEPVLIVFLALIVGLVLVAMYLPIFKLVSNFGI